MSRIADTLRKDKLAKAGMISRDLITTETVTLLPTENIIPATKITYEQWSKPAEAKAYCAWEVHGGVNISIENTARVSKYNNGASIELTVEEAFKLAQSLIQAAYDTLKLDRDFINDMANEEIERLKNDVYEPATEVTF